MHFRPFSLLALAAASSFALAASAQDMRQTPAEAASNMTSEAPPNNATSSSMPETTMPETTMPEATSDSTSMPPRPVTSARRARAGSTAAMDAAVQRVADQCDSELRNYCSGVPSGNGRVLSCLRGHRSDASSQCQAALDQVPTRYSSVKSAHRHLYRHATLKHHKAAAKKAPS
jgi:Cysteine rich repeat